MKWMQSLVFAAALASASAQAALIGFDNGPAGDIAVGDSFTIDVIVSDLQGDLVSAYDLDLLFADTLLQFDDLTFSGNLDTLGACTLCGFDLYAAGVLNVNNVSLDSDGDLLTLQGGAATALFTLSFTALAPGDAELQISFDNPQFLQDIKGADAVPLAITALPTTITIAGDGGGPVPEPQVWALLLLGALALFGRRRLRLR